MFVYDMYMDMREEKNSENMQKLLTGRTNSMHNPVAVLIEVELLQITKMASFGY
jgi:hypothetical protein